MLKAAVIILNYNGRNYLEQFLPGVVRHSAPHEVVVADNASTDDSVNYLESGDFGVSILSLEKNFGFCEGYNRAIRACDQDIVVLLNNDVEVTAGWLEPLLSFLNEHKEVAAVQPKIRSYHQRERFEFAGASGGYIDLMGYPLCRGRVLQHLEKDHGQYDAITPVFWATGACMAIRRKDFLDAGGFDPHFFAHMEEIDLCWRLWRNQREVYAVPNSMVFHVGGGTLSAQNPKKTYLNFRNGLALLYKNLPVKSLLPVIIFRLGLDLMAFILFIFQGKWRHSAQIFRAQSVFFWYLITGHYRRKKPYVSLRRLPHIKAIIPLGYYIQGKRKFSDYY